MAVGVAFHHGCRPLQSGSLLHQRHQHDTAGVRMFDTAQVGLFKPILPSLWEDPIDVDSRHEATGKPFRVRRPSWTSGVHGSPHCTSGAMSGIASRRSGRPAFFQADGRLGGCDQG